MKKIKVVIAGASGNVGRQLVKGIYEQPDLELVGAFARRAAGRDVGEVAGIGHKGLEIDGDLEALLVREKPDVLIDFTSPRIVMGNIKTAAARKVNMVIGTTGIGEQKLGILRQLCEATGVKAIYAPNFAITCILQMRIAQLVSRFLPDAEIIEYHPHDKEDSPSGTSLKTAHMMREVREQFNPGCRDELIQLNGVRGGDINGIKLHSVRVPGILSLQDIVFGMSGQTLLIRHQCISYAAFNDGVFLAVRKLKEINGFVYGLEGFFGDYQF